MEIKKEDKTDALHKPANINESEDLREHKHNNYDALSDLNKKPTKVNESKPLPYNSDYDPSEMLTEAMHKMVSANPIKLNIV